MRLRRARMEVLQAHDRSYGNGAGLTVTSIKLETVNYPQAVQEAVDDAQKARNDSERYRLEADTYANDIVPQARGQRAESSAGCRAYRDRVIADAQGEAARFEALLTEYQKAPRVTRDRLYIEAIEEVYGRSAKVIMDTQGSGNLLYLPLDKSLNRSGIQLPNAEGNRASRFAETPSRCRKRGTIHETHVKGESANE